MASKSLPARGGPDTKAVATGPPNQTLYCTQLPDKRIPKHDLRTALYALFSTYGTVLDIVVMKTNKMRGQAHVVFKDVQASTQALRALQGFDFFGKQMKIVYAKGSSNVISKLRGTYVAPVETAPAPVTTDLQKSIFGAPPGALPARPTTGANGEGQGLKRPREEESDNEEAPMDEDSDVPMEASSDEE
ncbi:U1 small nuclear ribonucleoprotein A/U2 small nuclear ribonucleoprotein B'' [Penicillium concentricum]|uniref:U1 small nuclear ribonucleoprotein A/U2 small nuclear ribonucleoprotein B n=1 Tax=Penicillium concentricum TaxID=293559 RepID=A0A9W9SW57_9EURO|nr:U1 small nuclear ribonucleoprotein A/U2 small nuclear ribonucleoprotein B'' [Penicillium concentricum]KAJ5385320.1 U1 small nuclear ribonucleoprotein A/U2 small nuclear ribonucleoprotein B'' [Penicillium concentricum]